MIKRFFAHPLVRGIVAVGGGLFLFYILIWVFWGTIFALSPPDIPPQTVYFTGSRVDSTVYYDPKTHAPIRTTYGDE